VLLCSHLLRDVEEVCDEVIILKDGDIVHHANLEEERRSDRRFVELEVSGQDGGLATALGECGAEGVSEGGGRWRIVLPPGMDVEVIWQLATRQDLLIHRMTHRRDSLEQIFLRAVGHVKTTQAPPGSDAPAGSKTETGAATVATANGTVANGHL
jgi:ABC-2 type transport system ATP-binding protein